MPRIYKTIEYTNLSPPNLLLYIEVIYHTKLNRPDQPCVESESYSFTACLINHLSSKVGCRLKWDTWSDPSRPLCSEVKQVFQYEDEFFYMSNLEQSALVRTTGCQLPCRYREYAQVDEPLGGFKPTLGLDIMFASANVVLDSEDYVYPFISFVAEFGGSLGLFLGFSFMMIVEYLEVILAT